MKRGITARHVSKTMMQESAAVCEENRRAMIYVRDSNPNGVAVNPKMGEWLRTLADEGYSMTDVALMFGLSRERIRQWAKMYGVAPAFLALGKGSKPRVFDWGLGRFVPDTPAGIAKTLRPAAQRARDIERAKRQHLDRIRLIGILTTLTQELGRTPTLVEMEKRTGLWVSSLARRFLGRPYRRGAATAYENGTRRLYRLAGLEVRKTGGHGHIVMYRNGSRGNA